MLKNTIFAALDARTEPVEVPEWGVTLYVKTMTGSERAAFITKAEDARKSNNPLDAVAWLVVMTAAEANGQRLFSDDDFGKVNGKSANVLDRISTASAKLNGLTDGAVDEAKKN